MPELKNGKLTLFLNDSTKSGKRKTHDASYLLARLAPNEAMTLAQKMEGYFSPFASPSGIAGAVSQVLLKWPATFPMFPSDSTSLFRAIKELRATWYQRANPRSPGHISLYSANQIWKRFIGFMRYMSRNGLPHMDYEALGTNPERDTEALRKAAHTVADLERVNEVRGQPDGAGYNNALVVPLSIHLSDEAYLAKYEHDLQEAMDLIYKAAVEDLDAFIRMEKAGQKLIEEFRPKYEKILARINPSCESQNRYIDSDSSEFSIFDPAHPKFFAYKLAMIEAEMGGIPKLFRERDPEQSTTEKIVYRQCAPARWKKLGKGLSYQDHTNLLGHLGIMSMQAMVACLAIIHAENPSINVMSLQRAELEDADGHSILLVNAGEGEAQRLVVDKARAHTQKSTIFQGKSQEALQCILRWTAKCRKALKDAGDPKANKLLLYMNRRNHITFADNYNINAAFCLQKSSDIRNLSFVARHAELSPWAERINLSALRVSAGVLSWFKSGGDEEATRRAFGHATSATSLVHYIPRQIQEAMNIRMIRRFQNLLICAACVGEDYLLRATDFLTMAELHEFLSQMLTGNGKAAGNDLLEAIRGAYGFRSTPKATETVPVAPVSLEDHETVYLTLTVDGLAMLLLYRERLLAADVSAQVLDTPDPKTGTKPRLWLELGNAFEQYDASIMERHPEYRIVIEQATKRADELRGEVRFPALAAV